MTFDDDCTTRTFTYQGDDLVFYTDTILAGVNFVNEGTVGATGTAFFGGDFTNESGGIFNVDATVRDSDLTVSLDGGGSNAGTINLIANDCTVDDRAALYVDDGDSFTSTGTIVSTGDGDTIRVRQGGKVLSIAQRSSSASRAAPRSPI